MPKPSKEKHFPHPAITDSPESVATLGANCSVALRFDRQCHCERGRLSSTAFTFQSLPIAAAYSCLPAFNEPEPAC